MRPERPAPYYYLALAARDQGNEAEAIHILEELLRRYPDHASSCEALGSLLMSAHRYPEAESSLEKAVRLNPKAVKARLSAFSLLLARMGKKAEADGRTQKCEIAAALDEAASSFAASIT